MCSIICLACAFVAVAAAHTKEVVLHSFAGPPPYGANPLGVVRDPAGNLYGVASSGGAFNQGAVFKMDASGNISVLHSFAGGTADGADPGVPPTLDSSGNLYGTTAEGGTYNGGIVYKLDPSGNEIVLYSGFPLNSYPNGVTLDSSGNLYGTTYEAGFGVGMVYKLDSSGNFTLLYSFPSPADTSGAYPRSSVTIGPAGNLYGTTAGGGKFEQGTVYKLDPSGNEAVLYSFSGQGDGGDPNGNLIIDSAGRLYGTTVAGGASACGTVYKWEGSGLETVLYSFAGNTDGCHPYAGVVRDSRGNLYGTTPAGGASNAGTVFKLNASGSETVLYSFSTNPQGVYHPSGLVLDPAGNLYGTTSGGGVVDLGLVFQITPLGQESNLHSFTGPADGSDPAFALTIDPGGNLYGTTRSGGRANLGVVFKLAPSGAETILHTFTGGTDGADPASGVVFDSAGNLYGTTGNGGGSQRGTVYKIDPSGNETVLHAFSGDEGSPSGGVAFDSIGNLYGGTFFGGPFGTGSVYKIDPSGNFTALYSFQGGFYDGYGPSGSVAVDSADNVYGTTEFDGPDEEGMVYKVDPSGNQTVVYTFTGRGNGGMPVSGVILDSAGNLYGTTPYGGETLAGTVYNTPTSGSGGGVYNFTGKAGGTAPLGVVALDPAGNVYGTTSQGGTHQKGLVYKLTPSGTLQVLYDFTGEADGGDPQAGVILGSNGSLYGITTEGGKSGGGVVFALRP